MTVWSAIVFPLVTLASSSIPDEIATDVFAALIAEERKSEEAHCLSIDDRDPSDAVLLALRARKYVVLPASDCYYERTEGHYSRARSAKFPAAAFLDLSGFVLRSQSVASIKYWHRAGAGQGYGSQVQIEQQNGRWSISERPGYKTVE